MRWPGYIVFLLLAVVVSMQGIAVASDTGVSSSPYEVYYTYMEYSTGFINSGSYDWTDPQLLLNELRGYIDQRHCAYDNHYIWVYTDIPDPSNTQYFLNRIDGYSKMHTIVLPSRVKIPLELDWHRWPPLRYKVYTGLRLVGGAEVMPNDIRSKDLMHQLYDNTRMRFFILATPFGTVTNPSAWVAIAQLPLPLPVDVGDDTAQALIDSGVYIVITFDFARTANPVAIQYYYSWNENGYYLLDFVVKFFRIAADQPRYVPKVGFYPAISYAISVVTNPNNDIDSVVQPGLIKQDGPLIITPNNVYPPIFWQETYPW